MNGLGSISPTGLTLLAVVISFIAIASLDSDELNVIGNLLIGIGGLLVISSSQSEFILGLEKERSREDMLNKQINLLHEEIKSLSGHHSSRDMNIK